MKTRRKATRVLHQDAPVTASPSGLPTRYIATPETGAHAVFVAEQTLEAGQAVPLHTHPVEEVLTFLQGRGEAECGEDRFEIGAGVSLVIPPGVVHGFRSTGDEPLRVLVIFPGDRFAITTRADGG